jgi:DNA-binding IclR family transcriptional regulator
MRSIADEFDVVCAAYFLEGDMLHLRDRAASASHVGYPVPLGTRMKMRSAQAVAFYSWSPRDAEAWLERANPRPGPAQTEHMLRSMELAREIGFVPMMRRPGYNFDGELNEAALTGETDDLPVVTLAELEPAKVYPLAAIMAPVFDAKGRVGFTLLMAGFHSALSGAQAMQAGERLRAACERISHFVAGRNVESD